MPAGECLDLESPARQCPFLVLNGMHGSGKTTAQIFLSDLGYLTHAEIGWAYRQLLARRHAERETLLGEDLAWYDRAIFEMEVARDKFIEAFTALPHCCETWHLGNLAYASQRSPEIIEELEEIFLAQTARLDPVFILLVIKRETFLKRCTLRDARPDQLYTFYRELHEVMLAYLERYDLPYHLVNNDRTPDDLRQALTRIVLEHETPC